MSFTPAQRHHAIGLYKRVLRTSRDTFAGDVATVSAWRQMVRKEFQTAKSQTDPAKIEEGLATWEDVVKVLRQNVVQGEYKEDRSAFQLKFTPDTELGSNESIKAGRQKQLDDLRASKGSLSCGRGSSSAKAGGSATHARQFSTSVIQRAAAAKADSSAEDSWKTGPLPRPVPHFGQMAILSDGSSIQLSTTSPRGIIRLTRDPTNHPLWNPKAEKGRGAGDEDESGRLARFRRRFGGAEEAVSSKESTQPAAANVASSAKRAATNRGGFSEEDFEWMGVGGREARAGSVEAKKAKGKGKK